MSAELTAIKIEIANRQKEFSLKQKIIAELEQEIKKLDSPTDLTVSEHAYLRYFERVKGYDLEEIKNEILSDTVLALVEKLGGSGLFPNGDYRVVIRNNVVITIK
jgi:hypothetical protein